LCHIEIGANQKGVGFVGGEVAHVLIHSDLLGLFHGRNRPLPCLLNGPAFDALQNQAIMRWNA
jgi:hypothetical protein